MVRSGGVDWTQEAMELLSGEPDGAVQAIVRAVALEKAGRPVGDIVDELQERLEQAGAELASGDLLTYAESITRG
jgi:hypothetical protein